MMWVQHKHASDSTAWHVSEVCCIHVGVWFASVLAWPSNHMQPRKQCRDVFMGVLLMLIELKANVDKLALCKV